MATTYTSTIQLRCWKEHTCICCGATYSYEFVRTVKGQGSSADAATANAQNSAKKVLERDVDLQPCPTCGLYQPDMLGQTRARRHWAVFWLTLIVFIVLVILRGTHVMQSYTAAWFTALVCGLAALFTWATDLKNPNADLMANRQLGADRVAAGQILHQPGRSVTTQEEQEWSRPGRSTFHGMLLITFGASVLLAIAPEVIRTVRGWPLNEQAYPPVVGPGDETKIYMPQKVSSIKGYWRGTARVRLQEGGASKLPIEIAASSSTTIWGKYLSYKSRDRSDGSVPWVKIRVPAEEAELGGKTVQCDIKLLVEYPESSGTGTFNDIRTLIDHQVTLTLAKSEGAGASYNGFAWEGMLLAMGSVVFGAIFLVGIARGFQRRATPTRLFTLTPPAPGQPGGLGGVPV